jgi:hypothetical protein
VWAPEEQGQFQPGRCSRWWLQRSLASLEADLAALGSRLRYVRAPESATALLAFAREAGAQALVFNHLYDPISMASIHPASSWRSASRRNAAGQPPGPAWPSPALALADSLTPGARLLHLCVRRCTTTRSRLRWQERA